MRYEAGGGVGAPSTEPGRHRDLLVEPERQRPGVHRMPDANRLRPPATPRCRLRRRPVPVPGPVWLPRRGLDHGELEPVGPPDRLEHRDEVVETVLTEPLHPQGQVDLGVGDGLAVIRPPPWPGRRTARRQRLGPGRRVDPGPSEHFLGAVEDPGQRPPQHLAAPGEGGGGQPLGGGEVGAGSGVVVRCAQLDHRRLHRGWGDEHRGRAPEEQRSPRCAGRRPPREARTCLLPGARRQTVGHLPLHHHHQPARPRAPFAGGRAGASYRRRRAGWRRPPPPGRR